MPIQTKQEIINILQERYQVLYKAVRRKKVFYETNSNGKDVVVCTPSSKIHKDGQGWIDLTQIQVKLMQDYDIAILVFRLQRKKSYYVNFKDISNFLKEEFMFVNKREGRHWKLYVWPDRIEVRGNNMAFYVDENVYDNLDHLFI